MVNQGPVERLRQEELLTVQEVANLLRVSPPYVYKLLNERKLNGLRVGPRSWRVYSSSLEEYLERLNGGEGGSNDKAQNRDS